MDALLSIEEAAHRLGGISKWTVNAWLSQGRLPRTKVGARTMIRESHLSEFVARCNNQASPESLAASKPTCKGSPEGSGNE